MFFFLVLFAGEAAAQSGAKIEIDSNIAETGNPFRIHLSVPGNAGKPSGPDFSVWDTVLPRKNILRQTDWRAEGGNWTKDLTIITFDEDTLQLPPLPIPLSGGGQVLSNALSIQVIPTPSPDELNRIAGIKDIHRDQVTWQDYLPWIIGIALFLIAMLLLYRYLTRKTRKDALRRTIELPPHQLAMKKLEGLQAARLWQQGHVKRYYEELSFIIREYLEKQFHVPVLESTSGDAIRLLGTVDAFPAAALQQLQELLQQADLAKFAKAIPPDSYHENALSFVQQLVAQTTPEPSVNKPVS
jgi:hypothetical protein